MRCVQQCDVLAPCELAKISNRRIRGQLLSVAAAKLSKSFWPMVEPNSQFWTWRDVLHPKREFRARLTNAARPEPIDQDSRAISRRRGLANSFYGNCHANPLRVEMRIGYGEFRYSARLIPEPPISLGMSLNFGLPS